MEITNRYLKKWGLNTKRAKTFHDTIVHIRTDKGLWRENAAGYCFSRREAGTYLFEDAWEHIRGLGIEKGAVLLRADARDVIYSTVMSGLNAATLENEYPHEYDRDPAEIVDEVNDWSGIDMYDRDNPEHVNAGVEAVIQWRKDHPQSTQ